MSTNYDSGSDDLNLQPLLAQAQPPDPVSTAGRELRVKLAQEISLALARTSSPFVREVAEVILHEFVNLFGRLSLIESNLHKLDTLLENLSILEVLQFEIRSLLDFIQFNMSAEGIGDKLREALDGICYG